MHGVRTAGVSRMREAPDHFVEQHVYIWTREARQQIHLIDLWVVTTHLETHASHFSAREPGGPGSCSVAFRSVTPKIYGLQNDRERDGARPETPGRRSEQDPPPNEPS